jgi:GT2 family glycosyltransferase
MVLSIIIPSYNTKKLTLACINSIYENKPRFSYEIIIVDNASTDGSSEEILRLNKKEILVIANSENLGFSKAVNQGIIASKGKYKLLLNSDTLVTEGALDEMVEFAQKEKDAGVVGARLLNADGSIQPSCYNFPTVWRSIQQYWLGKKGVMDKFYPQGDSPTEVEAVVGAAFLISPLAINKVGLMDEKYFMFYEDLDYCRKVWQNGLKVYYLPSARIVHFHGQSGKMKVDPPNQWRRLIPSSKKYHGLLRHSIITFVIWSSQKLKS